MRIGFVCIHRFEEQITQSYISYSVYMPEHRQLHNCVKAGGDHSPYLFLSLQFFNNQDDFTEDFAHTVVCLFSLPCPVI